MLTSNHQQLIHDSAISREVAEQRGYWSATKKSELKDLGFAPVQAGVPALVIPIRNIHGEIATYLMRRDEPRIKDGRPLKYEIPSGSTMVLDVPHTARPDLDDPKVPLYITEGSRKADAAVTAGLCCVSLIGVWCWRKTNEKGGKVALPEFEAIALNGRDVYVVFDSDVMVKESVHSALARLVAFLKTRDARVKPVYLPTAEDGSKVGLDDFLAAGHGLNDVLACAETGLRRLPLGVEAATEYEVHEDGLTWNHGGRNGTTPIQLTNFVARIIGDVVRDDGVEQARYFEIEAELAGRTSRFRVSAAEFDQLAWVNEHIGAGAIVGAGFQIREHTRVAIQTASTDIVRRRSYAHLGWAEVDGAHVYLHAGGAIGAEGVVEGVEVDLEDKLAGFVLPEPPSDALLITAVRASLSILDAAPTSIAFPTMSAVYRAPLGPCPHGMHFIGSSGIGKSVVAALAQQHWGATMDYDHLPASWTATANYLEGLAFAAKDTLLVVDDLVLGNSRRDLESANKKAERVYRAQGNLQGRGRMRADARLHSTRHPRGIVLGTGEDFFPGQSLRARVSIIEFSPGDVNFDLLADAQRAGADGVFAQTMAGYVQWLAADYPNRVVGAPQRIAALRTKAHQSDHHRRTSATIASLQVGFQSFLTFAKEIGALTDEEATELNRRCWDALASSAKSQLPQQTEADIPRRFLTLLGSAIAGGRGHLAACPSGGMPENPGDHGWTNPTPDFNSTWQAQGGCVGYTNGDDLYLNIDVALGVAQQLAGVGGQHLGITPTSLAKGLHERGLLRRTDLDGRSVYKVRVTIGSRRQEVLHLGLDALGPDQDAVSPTGPTTDPTNDGDDDIGQEDPSGRVGQIPLIPDPQTEHSIHPAAADEQGTTGPPGPTDQPPRPAVCNHEGHQSSEWLSKGGVWTCGICHPAATPSVVADPNSTPRDQEGGA